MDSSQLLRVSVAFALVFVNGWFVLAEFALVKVRVTRLRELAGEGNRAARRALAVVGDLDEYLSAIQLGITFASLGLGWLGEPAIAGALAPAFANLPASAAVTHGAAVTVAFLTITFLHVVLGEMAPKTMAIQRAEAFALSVARPLRVFYVLTYPLIVLLQRSSTAFVRLVGFRPMTEAHEAHTGEELRMIVAASHRQGVLDEATRDLIDNVFEYNERVAREVMTPRRDVVALDVRVPLDRAIRTAVETEYTRYPLVDGDTDRVLGFVHLRDLMATATGRRRVDSLAELAREPLFVPETAPIDRVRRQLQARRTHFGIVVDEFGDFSGIVTLEDLLEELVGEIQDELDVERPKILRRPDGSIEVDAGLLLETARKKLDLHILEEVDGVDTLGGYVFSLLGRGPRPGDAVAVGDHRLEVLETDEMRILRLRLSPAAPRPDVPPEVPRADSPPTRS